MSILLRFLVAFALATGFLLQLSPAQQRAAQRGDGGSQDATGEPRPDGEGRRRGRWRRGGEDRENNPPTDSRPAPAATAPAPSTTSFGTTTDADRIRKTASDTIKTNDKDSNGILEGAELEGLRMSRGADADSDGKITHNELVKFYTPKSAGAAQPAGVQSEKKAIAAEEDVQRKIAPTGRKSFRFKSNKERVADWRFSARDANGDGQVSMTEYSRSWTDRTADEFMRYDTNNDGMITADETR